MIGVHNTDGVPLSWDKYNLLIWNLQKSLSMADTGIFTISHGKENIRIAGQLRTLKKTTTTTKTCIQTQTILSKAVRISVMILTENARDKILRVSLFLNYKQPPCATFSVAYDFVTLRVTAIQCFSITDANLKFRAPLQMKYVFHCVNHYYDHRCLKTGTDKKDKNLPITTHEHDL